MRAESLGPVGARSKARHSGPSVVGLWVTHADSSILDWPRVAHALADGVVFFCVASDKRGSGILWVWIRGGILGFLVVSR